MKGFIKVVQDIGLLLARVAFGIVLVLRGWDRWQGTGMTAQVERIRQMGLPQPDLLAWGSMILEVAGGALLVFGLFTPVIGLVLLVQQVVVIAYGKWAQGLSITDGGFEYNLVQAALACLFMVFGSGRAGVDNLLRRPSSESRKRVDDADPA